MEKDKAVVETISPAKKALLARIKRYEDEIAKAKEGLELLDNPVIDDAVKKLKSLNV